MHKISTTLIDCLEFNFNSVSVHNILSFMVNMLLNFLLRRNINFKTLGKLKNPCHWLTVLDVLKTLMHRFRVQSQLCVCIEVAKFASTLLQSGPKVSPY